MRICVLGAGAIGGLLAARLAHSGQAVSLLARGESLSVIASSGLRLVEPDGATNVVTDLAVSDDLSSFGPQDLVILALKAHQIGALAAGIDVLYGPDTVVLPLQNGVPWWFFQKFPGPFSGRRLDTLDPDGRIESHIPAERIVASIAYPAAERSAPGVVNLIEGDRFPVGELDGTRSERATEIAHALGAAGLRSRVLTDIRSHLWIKAWGNLAFNPISALTGASLAEICRFPATRGLARQMMLEASAIAERLGLALRLSVDQRIEGAEKVGDHKTSMLQDVEAGQPLEVEPLIGSFIELGRLTEVPTPAIETVYSLVCLLNARLLGASR